MSRRIRAERVRSWLRETKEPFQDDVIAQTSWADENGTGTAELRRSDLMWLLRRVEVPPTSRDVGDDNG